ncbi:nuclear transport factor 2 family protein [Allorhizocola rhizosphaerae]|uniref:nuclear transport factor 2 family protein n=1 Tax=Allorhizocola rhizosphaerae TaxID=1872709 RepID=UPI001B8B0BE1|nr:nuclear transport factor 2 family protein [Allorhizocola rhizosphaerae]
MSSVETNNIARRTVVAGALGAAAGAIAMAPGAQAASPAGLSRVDDVNAIRAAVDGIDDAVDAKDWARCRALFTDQVDVDFASLGGGAPARIPADQLIANWRRNLYAEKTSFHQRSNHDITITGDRAGVRSKGYAFNRLIRPLGDAIWEVWGHYTHRLIRTRDGWRCTAIALTTVAHARGNELAWTHVPSE